MRLTMLAILFALLVPATSSAKSLIGSWSVYALKQNGKTHKMPPGGKMIMAFKKGGQFLETLIAKRPGRPPRTMKDRGTWRTNGKMLTIRSKDTLISSYQLTTNKLILKSKRSGTMLLRRLN